MRRFLVFLSVILCFLLVGSVFCFADGSSVDLTKELSVSQYVSLVQAGTIPELVVADPQLVFQAIYDGGVISELSVGSVVSIYPAGDNTKILGDINTDSSGSTSGLSKTFPANSLAYPEAEKKGFLENVLDVFSSFGSWISSAIDLLIGLFWADGSLTVIGVLSVCGLGLAVISLLISFIRRFFNFAG